MMATFTLSSAAFVDGGQIPRRHSCDGPDLSPPLAWSGAPAGTVAFALLVEDPDARGFVHWVAAPIDGGATTLPEGVPAAGPPVQGRNDFGRGGWGGPCPPSGTHRYVFTLYALSKVPVLPSRPTAADVRRAIAATILAEARLVGTYRR
jgi:Raf kinase inhibitor-like YbhB/YbcL family protein